MRRLNVPRVWPEDEAVVRAVWRVPWLDRSVAVVIVVVVVRLVRAGLIVEVAAWLVVEHEIQALAVAAVDPLEAS